MSRLEDNFRKVEPYVPGEQPNLPDMVKLNTNENPYPPSPKVAEALQKFELDSLRLYPDPESTDLVNALAERYHVQADQVYTGVGSDDVLAIAFLTFFNSGPRCQTGGCPQTCSSVSAQDAGRSVPPRSGAR